MTTENEPRSIAPTIHKQATDTKADQSHQTDKILSVLIF
jgi:hypothetical protein